MSSQSASMYEASFWKVAFKPFKFTLSIVLVLLALEVLIVTSHLLYLKYWLNLSDALPLEYMQRAVSDTWNSTLYHGKTTNTSVLAVKVSDFFYWLFFKATWIHSAVEDFAKDLPSNSLDTVLRNSFAYPLRHEIHWPC
jgi:hypothetical protein